MRRMILAMLIGAALSTAVGLAVLWVGWVPVEATSDPPNWESALAHKMLAAAVARRAPKLQNPIPPTSANLRAGLKLYRENCSGCHGDSGQPSQRGTTGYYPRAPQFDRELPSKPDWQMFWIVRHGVRYSGMGGWEKLMPEENTWRVVTFVGHMRDLPADVEDEWKSRPTQ